MPAAASVACTLAVNGLVSNFVLRYALSATPQLAAVQLGDESAGSYVQLAGLAEPTPLVSSVQATELLLLGSGFGNSSTYLKVRPDMIARSRLVCDHITLLAACKYACLSGATTMHDAIS